MSSSNSPLIDPPNEAFFSFPLIIFTDVCFMANERSVKDDDEQPEDIKA